LSFDGLAAALEKKDREGKIRALFLIGDAAEEISATLQRVTPHMHFDLLPGLEEVFEALPQMTKPGDVVLLSPACASFDRYGDYQERGKHFQKMVEDYHRGKDGC
jgi:UDP-N-acetylmuramoylalanine--D-glutamate ligase